LPKNRLPSCYRKDGFKPTFRGTTVAGKAKTGAERQAEYREKKKHSEGANGHALAAMNVYVTAPNRARLNTLARRHGMTQAEMLNRLIEQAPEVQALEAEKDDFLSGKFSQ